MDKRIVKKFPLPKFFFSALEILGFSDAASFGLIDDTTAFHEALEEKVIQIARDETTLPEAISNEALTHIQSCHLPSIDNYKIPFAVRLKLQAIIDWSKQKTKSGTRNKKINIDRWREMIQEKFTSMTKSDAGIGLTLKDNVCTFHCPLCSFQTNVNLASHPTELNASNAYRHFSKHPPQQHDSPFTSEDEEESEPPAKRRAIEMSEDDANISDESSLSSLEISRAVALLQELIRNAEANAIGSKGNRFSKRIRRLCGFLYARGGQFLYKFLSTNFNLPCLKTIQNFMIKDLPPLCEGILNFDGLERCIQKFKYSTSIGVFEDGAAIVENITYDSRKNQLIGLCSPFDHTGIPQSNFHVANSSFSIINAINEYRKTNTVQVMIARPNTTNAIQFLLGFYFTDNRFNYQDVVNRYSYVNREFQARGWKLLTFNMDGDPKGLKAQKILSHFGSISEFCGAKIAAPIDQGQSCSQDYWHLLKKYKSAIFSKILRIGNKCAMIGHLEMLLNMFDKFEHGLIKSDLNVLDRLDYSCIPKILDDRVTLRLQELEETEGTIAFLDKMKDLRIAYIDANTHPLKRVYHATKATYFIRFWRQFLHDSKIDPKKHFITDNAFHGGELNYKFLLKAVSENESHNIHQQSSQCCESHFREIRSFSSKESTVVNVDAKKYKERLHKVIYQRKISQKMPGIIFPKLEKEKRKPVNLPIPCTINEIKKAVEDGIRKAEEDARALGMTNFNVNLSLFLKQPKSSISETSDAAMEFVEEISDDDEEENDEPKNYFGNQLDVTEDENSDEELSEEEIKQFQSGKITFLDEKSVDKFTTILIKNEKKKILKWQLLSMIKDDKIRVSTDIKFRYHAQRKKQINVSRTLELHGIWKENLIKKGDNIICKESTDCIIVGRIVAFQNNARNGKKSSPLYLPEIDFNLADNVGVLLDLAHKIDVVKKTKTSLDLFGKFIDLDTYICHCRMDIDIRNHRVLSEIFKFMSSNDV